MLTSPSARVEVLLDAFLDARARRSHCFRSALRLCGPSAKSSMTLTECPCSMGVAATDVAVAKKPNLTNTTTPPELRPSEKLPHPQYSRNMLSNSARSSPWQSWKATTSWESANVLIMGIFPRHVSRRKSPFMFHVASHASPDAESPRRRRGPCSVRRGRSKPRHAGYLRIHISAPAPTTQVTRSGPRRCRTRQPPLPNRPAGCPTPCRAGRWTP